MKDLGTFTSLGTAYCLLVPVTYQALQSCYGCLFPFCVVAFGRSVVTLNRLIPCNSNTAAQWTGTAHLLALTAPGGEEVTSLPAHLRAFRLARSRCHSWVPRSIPSHPAFWSMKEGQRWRGTHSSPTVHPREGGTTTRRRSRHLAAISLGLSPILSGEDKLTPQCGVHTY